MVIICAARKELLILQAKIKKAAVKKDPSSVAGKLIKEAQDCTAT